jgi:hypothetical protein
MRNLFLVVVFFLLLCCNLTTYADTQASFVSMPTPPNNTPATSFPLMRWISRNSSDPIIINNGNASNLYIQITVNSDAPAAGLIIQNCGTTTAIRVGSVAICTSTTASGPISFHSDSDHIPASGTYQILLK